VIFVLAIIVASPTNVSVLGVRRAQPLMFNVVQFQKPLNTKVINILFTFLSSIIIIEHAKLVQRTMRSLYLYAPIAISPWESDVQIFH
jgi:hypothetical protein